MPVLPDWYCCLSVALDAEEDEQYSQQYYAYIAAGGDPKKFPKQRHRHMEPVAPKNPGDMIFGAIAKSGLQMPSLHGSVDEFARSRGIQKIYQLEDGTFVNEAGEPVEPTAGSVFVPSKGP